MLWQSWGDERLAMRGLKRAKIGDSTQFLLIFAVSFLFFHQYEQHFVNNVAQASSHTKSYVLAVLDQGSATRGLKGPKMAIWLNFHQFFLLLLLFLHQHLHLRLHLHQHKLQFVRKCGPGILLLYCTKVPCCDSKEGMNGQLSRVSKRPKVAIWLNAD